MPEFPKNRSSEISKASLCGFLEAGSGLMMTAAVNALIWQQYWATIGTSLVGIGFEAYAAINGCDYNPEDPIPFVPSGECSNCCSAASGGGGDIVAYANGTKYPQSIEGWTQVTRVEGPYTGPDPNTNYWNYSGFRGDARTNFQLPLPKTQGKPCVCIENIVGGSCQDDDKDDPKTPSYDFTDPETGCTWNVYVVDSFIGPGGLPVLRYRASSNNPSLCGPDYEWWFYPDGTVQPVVPDPPEQPEPTQPPTPGPDDGPTPTPDDPVDDPVPPIPAPTDPPAPPLDCCNAVLVAVQQLKNAVSVVDQNLRNHMNNMTKTRVADRDKDQFTAACDKNDDGELESKEYQLVGGQGLFPMLQALQTNQNELTDLLQQHLEWRTPICEGETSDKNDTAVTVRFVSAQYSASGNDYLHKRLRYFSSTAGSLETYAAKWSGFTWKSGPFVVQHVGTALGAPQVWAETEDEAKRVIRKCFEGEGIDPDEEGSWKSWEVSSARYGEVQTMSPYKRDQYIWVTSRRGPSGSVELAPDPTVR